MVAESSRRWLALCRLSDRHVEFTESGMMTTRYGRGPVMIFFTGIMLLGLLLTLFSPLWVIFPGMLLFSAGFFAAHSVASSWIGPRARRAEPGLVALSVQLLSWFQHCRDSWRCVLASIWLERRRRVYRFTVGWRPAHRPAAA